MPAGPSCATATSCPSSSSASPRALSAASRLSSIDEDAARRGAARRRGARRGSAGAAASGSRTTNSAPCPCRRSDASTVPPCSLDEPLHEREAEAEPAQAARRASCRACENGSKRRASSSRARCRRPCRGRGAPRGRRPACERQPDRVAARGELRRVLEQVPDHLREARRVAVDPQRRVRERDLESRSRAARRACRWSSAVRWTSSREVDRPRARAGACRSRCASRRAGRRRAARGARPGAR